MKKATILSAMVLIFGLAGISPAWCDPLSFLEQQADIPLSGGISRFHYQALNPQTGMLYIAHMGAGQIIVFNTQVGQVTKSLPGFPGVTGLLVLPELHRLYACVTHRHQVDVINTESLKTVAHIAAGHFPDSLAYVPETHQLYVRTRWAARSPSLT